MKTHLRQPKICNFCNNPHAERVYTIRSLLKQDILSLKIQMEDAQGGDVLHPVGNVQSQFDHPGRVLVVSPEPKGGGSE